MEYQAFLNHWLLLPQIWLIIGMLIVLAELFDGSQVFFLPVGLGGIFTSGALYLERLEVIPQATLPENWYGMLIVWALGSIAVALLLSLRRRRQQAEIDVNDY